MFSWSDTLTDWPDPGRNWEQYKVGTLDQRTRKEQKAQRNQDCIQGCKADNRGNLTYWRMFQTYKGHMSGRLRDWEAQFGTTKCETQGSAVKMKIHIAVMKIE
jgi:hypothetical protein